MPEAPEIKHVTQQLDSVLREKTLLGVQFPSGKHSFYLPLPSVLKGVRNRGKTILFEFFYSNGNSTNYLYSGLGMTGSWSLQERAHCHIVLTFANQFESTFNVYFCDTRPFGRSTVESSLDKLNTLALPILQGHNDFASEGRLLTQNEFVEICRSKKAMITPLLLDQHQVCCGIGAYILTEALYLTCIHPKTQTNTLPEAVLRRLYRVIVDICETSFRHGGNSFKDYIDIESRKGSYQDRLLIYGKKHDPYHFPILKIKVSGRNISYCPKQIYFF